MSVLVKGLLRDYYSMDNGSKFDIDTAIEYLTAEDKFNEEERIVLKLTIDQLSNSEISKVTRLNKSTITKIINRISKKISDYLGVEYQDEKIVREAEFRLGRKLTPDEEKFCWKVIRAGRPIKKGINIFNFRDKKDDTDRGKDKTEGQVDV